MSDDKVLWKPGKEFAEESHLFRYKKWLENRLDRKFEGYEQMWEWTADQVEDFWEGLLEYFNVEYSGDYEKVCTGGEMPGVSWFEGIELNYAEHAFRNRPETGTAIIWKAEGREPKKMGWQELEERVAAFQGWLRSKGVQKGDRVVAFIANIPEATIAFLAVSGLGAIWSSCSPDFGLDSIVDRFEQIGPKVLLAGDGTSYNGKEYPKLDIIKKLEERIDSIEEVVVVPFLRPDRREEWEDRWTSWKDIGRQEGAKASFERVPFAHPIWVLYSSGTTGNPKAITHSHGGVLLEHLKYLSFHNDVHEGENFFWYSTTGWMMWNFVQASFLVGATAVLYEGSPAWPDLNALWEFIDLAGINHFGTSAPFLVACMKNRLRPWKEHDLSKLRSIGSTGSPLPPEGFDWVYKEVKKDLWLCSMSGGTDVCTAFVGGCPLKPVYPGEIQARALGCALYAYDEDGHRITGEVGEMVIEKPMPSMPIYFWNDEEMERYKSSYFEMFPGKWRHGDWVEVNERGGLIIYGRSDATLNRQGVRIGTSEIYRALNTVEEVKDSLIVNLELSGGRHFMPLFVVMKEGEELNGELKEKIKKTLRETYSPRHVPDAIVKADDIPYTISGKKMEAPVKKILLGKPVEKSINRDSMRNPESVQFYVDYACSIEH